MRHTKEALEWIVKILRQEKIPFRIIGGLAAELYGSRRKLADIDIDVPGSRIRPLAKEVNKYIIFGPKAYHDRHWDLLLMTLRYKGQVIDICSGDHTKIFDHTAKKWLLLRTDFKKSKMKYFDGLRLPVEPEGELLDYKRKLGRKVDKIDVRNLEKGLK